VLSVNELYLASQIELMGPYPVIAVHQSVADASCAVHSEPRKHSVIEVHGIPPMPPSITYISGASGVI
jgi:hypothetical protein